MQAEERKETILRHYVVVQILRAVMALHVL